MRGTVCVTLGDFIFTILLYQKKYANFEANDEGKITLIWFSQAKPKLIIAREQKFTQNEHDWELFTQCLV